MQTPLMLNKNIEFCNGVNTTIVNNSMFLLKIRMSFYKILIKIHLSMCLALKKRPFTKERKRKTKVKTNTTSSDCFEKTIIKYVNSCEFKIVYKHCLYFSFAHYIRRGRQIEAV